MILTDSEILKAVRNGDIKIKDFDTRNLNSNSYEVSLSKNYTRQSSFDNFSFSRDFITIEKDDIYFLESQEEFYSEKYVIVAFSTLGASKIGLSVLLGSGLTEIGYEGKIVIPLYTPCSGYKTLNLNSKIVKVCFFKKEGFVIHKYGAEKTNDFDVKISDSNSYRERFIDSGIAGIDHED